MKTKGSLGFAMLCGVALALSFSAGAAPAPAPADPSGAATRVDTLDAKALAGKPELWARAIRVSFENKDFAPGKVVQRVFELDDKGKIKSTTDAEVALSLDPAGKVKSDIVKVTKDGKDITADERKKAAEREAKAAKEEAKEKAKKEKAASKKSDAGKDAAKSADAEKDEESYSMSLGEGPFDPKVQADLKLTELPARETIEGRSCAVYDYSYLEKPEKPSKEKPVTISGKAWIEESTGNPVRLEFMQKPLPKHVNSMKTSIVYGPEGDKWIAAAMRFDVRAAFLLIKKNIRGDMLFSDYWKYVEPEEKK